MSTEKEIPRQARDGNSILHSHLRDSTLERDLDVPRGNAARRLSRGFTLIEVLISLVILSTGVVLILRAFQTSVLALGESKNAMLASALMRDKIEEVRMMALESGSGAILSLAGRFSDDEGFTGELRIGEMESAPDGSNTLSKVAVTVWRGGHGAQYSASTYVGASKSDQKGAYR